MHAAALQAPQPTPTQPGATELRALLASLAEESGELAQTADGLQVLFGQLMAEPPQRPSDALEQAQALDGLVQRLQGVETFLRGLCGEALLDLPAEAGQVASALRLTSQVRRFSPVGAEVGLELSAGDCDLF